MGILSGTAFDPDDARAEDFGIISTGASMEHGANRAWLEPQLAHMQTIESPVAPGGSYEVWTGPVDVPPRGEPERWTVSGVGALDPDGDGLVPEHDNCPLIDNPDQADDDGGRGDGVGDVNLTVFRTDGLECDVDCENATDEDRDRVFDTCDNCPGLPNFGMGGDGETYDQSDCDGDGVGDACTPDRDGDGIPDPCDACPDFAVSSSVNCNLDGEIADDAPRLPDPCDPNPCATAGASSRAVGGTRMTNDVIAGEGLITTGMPGSTLAATIRTGFRFCPCRFRDPGRRARCATDPSVGCTVDRGQYTAGSGRTAWLPMTLMFDIGEQVAPSEAIVRYDRPHDEGLSGVADYEAVWNFVADATAAGTLETDATGATRTRAVFWSLAVDYDRLPLARPMVDTCNVRGSCPPLDGNLNSHYWAAIVESPPPRSFRRPDPDLTPIAPMLIPDSLCPTCANAFPLPHLVTRLCVGPCPTPEVYARLEPGDLEITDRIAPGVADELTAGRLRWVAPTEPRESLDLPHVRLLGVDPDTLDVQLLLSAETGILSPPSQFVEKISDPPGAFPVLRATRGQYLVVGGIPAPQSLQIISLESGETRWAPLSGELPTKVAAATVDATRDMLLIVDSVPAEPGTGEYRRLLAVDMETGVGSVLARRRRTPGRDLFALAAAPGGSFVLAVSNESARRHALYWLSLGTDGRLSFRGIAPGPGVVVGQMTAGAEGVSRPVSRRHGPGFRVIGTRWTDFRPPRRPALREML